MRAYRRTAFKAILLSTCLLSPAVLMPTIAFAQDAEPEATNLEEIVVTGAIEYRDRTDTTAPELVYDQEFFAKFEPTSVGDQLRRVPGVAFTSDIGEADAPQLRGLGQGFTQILVNGRPIPGAGNDRSVFVDRIPAEIIDRIEIVRSPSADIDSQGVGGTINIILKDGESLPPGIIARAGVTYDMDREEAKPNVSLSWSGRNAAETLLYSVTLDAQQRYNNKQTLQEVFESDSIGFDDEVAAGGDGRRLFSEDRTQSRAVGRTEEDDSRDSTDLSFNGDLTWRLSNTTSLRVDAFVLSTDRDEHQDTINYEGDGTVGGLDLDDPELEFEDTAINQDSRGASAVFNTKLSENTKLEIQARYNQFLDDTVQEKFEETPDGLVERESVDADDTEWSADAAITQQLPGLAAALNMENIELKVGIAGKIKERDYSILLEEDLGDPDFGANDGAFNYEEHRLDGFARVEWEVTPTITVQTGVRVESTKIDIDARTDFFEGGVLDETISSEASSDELKVNPSAHLVWEATGADQFRFSVARTVRRPSIDQLLPSYSQESPGDEDVTIGNPNLSFETSLGFDIGYERRLAGRGILGINLFQRDIEDLIGLVATGVSVDTIGLDPGDFPGGLYTYRNIGDAKVRGIELDLSTPLTFLGLPDTGFFANYTRLWSDRANPDGSGGDIMVDYQPEYVYNFGVTHTITSWDASVGFSYQEQGESRFVTFGEIESQLYDGNLEVFLEKRLGERMVLRLTGTNLLDAVSSQAESGFDGDNGAELLANQAAFNVDAYEIETEESSPKITLTLRAVF